MNIQDHQRSATRVATYIWEAQPPVAIDQPSELLTCRDVSSIQIVFQAMPSRRKISLKHSLRRCIYRGEPWSSKLDPQSLATFCVHLSPYNTHLTVLLCITLWVTCAIAGCLSSQSLKCYLSLKTACAKSSDLYTRLHWHGARRSRSQGFEKTKLSLKQTLDELKGMRRIRIPDLRYGHRSLTIYQANCVGT